MTCKVKFVLPFSIGQVICVDGNAHDETAVFADPAILKVLLLLMVDLTTYVVVQGMSYISNGHITPNYTL